MPVYMYWYMSKFEFVFFFQFVFEFEFSRYCIFKMFLQYKKQKFLLKTNHLQSRAQLLNIKEDYYFKNIRNNCKEK